MEKLVPAVYYADQVCERVKLHVNRRVADDGHTIWELKPVGEKLKYGMFWQ